MHFSVEDIKININSRVSDNKKELLQGKGGYGYLQQHLHPTRI